MPQIQSCRTPTFGPAIASHFRHADRRLGELYKACSTFVTEVQRYGFDIVKQSYREPALLDSKPFNSI